jgi:hypothetical protein
MSEQLMELETLNTVPSLSPRGEQQQAQDGVQDAHPPARHEFSLPPVDRGKDAWLFLAACWAVEALVWGKFVYVHISSPLYPYRLTGILRRLRFFFWGVPGIL